MTTAAVVRLTDKLGSVKNLYFLERMTRQDGVHFAYHGLLSRAVAAIGEDEVLTVVGDAETGAEASWSLNLMIITTDAVIEVRKGLDESEGTVEIHPRSALQRLTIDAAALITSDHPLARRDNSLPTVTVQYPFGSWQIETVSAELLAELRRDIHR